MALTATPENIQALCTYLSLSMDPDAAKRKGAEGVLTGMIPKPGFPILLLQILDVNGVDLSIKLAGAVFFKNLVKNHWGNREANTISATDRDQIKSNIVNLMLTAPPTLQKQLSAAMELISEADFPAQWQNLLPELIKRLDTTEYSVINGVLDTTHSIFKRYRSAMKSQEVLEELKYVLTLIQQPLLTMFQRTSQLIDQNATNPDLLKTLMTSIKLMLKIFYSLNSIDLPEFFEDHMNEWMTLFRKYLTYQSTSPKLIGDEDDQKPSVLHQVQACVCQNINLYIEKYEEEFNLYLETFLKDVWELLMKTGTAPKYDSLVSAAIRFMSSVTTSVRFELFKDPEILKSICEKIVIPNLELRDILSNYYYLFSLTILQSDLELFEDNPVEYIRRDIEGSDSETRRKSATELVKGLRKHYEMEVTQICSAYITTMLDAYSKNPKQSWKAKDIAIYLVTALAVRSATAALGTTNVNQLVPVLDFFKSQILPEIQAPQTPSLVLKADAMKFISTFRQQIPKEGYHHIVPILATNLLSPNYVVHTYAAACIERLLTVKDKIENVNMIRFGKQDIQPYLAACLTNLFKVLATEESKENDYVMKAIMRVVTVAQEDMSPFSTECIKQLVAILLVVCKNPSNPSFNHYLFETIAAVIKNISTKSPEATSSFELQLFEPFQWILVNDVQEFAPYVFQILALLLEVTPTTSNLSGPYMAMLPGLLTPALWEKQGNIPALVRLLQAYLMKGARQIVQANHLNSILGIFQKLIASKTHDHEGFFLLEAIISSLTPSDFAAAMPEVFKLVFVRLQRDKTIKFVKSFLVFLALFIGKHTPDVVILQIDAVQKDLFANILESLWLPNIQKVNGTIERKMTVIAMTKLVAESTKMLEAPYFPQIWAKLLPSILGVLEGPEDESVPPDMQDESDLDEFQGYTTAFSALHQAMKADQDPFKEVDDPKKYLATALYQLCRRMPNKFVPIIDASIGAEGRKFLDLYFKSASLQEPYLV